MDSEINNKEYVSIHTFVRSHFNVNINEEVLGVLIEKDRQIPNIIKESMRVNRKPRRVRFEYLEQGYDHSDRYFLGDDSLFEKIVYARDERGNKIRHVDVFMGRVENLEEIDKTIVIRKSGDRISIKYRGEVSEMLKGIDYIEDPLENPGLDTYKNVAAQKNSVQKNYQNDQIL